MVSDRISKRSSSAKLLYPFMYVGTERNTLLVFYMIYAFIQIHKHATLRCILSFKNTKEIFRLE